VTTSKVQDPQYAADVGVYATVVVQVRRLGAAPVAGTLQLQHAAVNVEDQYENVGATMNLATTQILTIVVTTHSRFLRWSITGLNGNVTIQIDIVGRE
jgi:hypothetical protein